MEPKSRLIVPDEEEAYTPKYLDAMDWLRTWKLQNPQEYDEVVQRQEDDRNKKARALEKQQRTEELDRLYFEEQRAQEEHRLAMGLTSSQKETTPLMIEEEDITIVPNPTEDAQKPDRG